MKILAGLVTATLLLAGCGSPDDPEYAERERERREAAQQRESVFDPMTGTMDRADGVNEINMGRTDRLDEAIEESDE